MRKKTTKQFTLKDLAVDHDYYASDSNFYSREANENYTDWEDFMSEYNDVDIDMNLVYRWDIYEDDGKYSMQMIFIRQRKGIYAPCWIDEITENDVPQIIKFLKPHLEKLKKIWLPIE